MRKAGRISDYVIACVAVLTHAIVGIETGLADAFSARRSLLN